MSYAGKNMLAQLYNEQIILWSGFCGGWVDDMIEGGNREPREMVRLTAVEFSVPFWEKMGKYFFYFEF